MSEQRTSVLIADDHPLYRDGVARAIKDWPELELLAEAGDGREALDAIRELRPDVAVLDLNMPELDGIKVLAALAQDEDLPTRVVLLSAATDSALVYDAIAAGAAAYLSKDAGRQMICETIVAVARGETRFSPEVHEALAEQIRRRGDENAPDLSPREREILVMLADGRSAPEIAEQLFLSRTTVKTHLQHLYRKLEVSDRAAAVAVAMRRGLLD